MRLRVGRLRLSGSGIGRPRTNVYTTSCRPTYADTRYGINCGPKCGVDTSTMLEWGIVHKSEKSLFHVGRLFGLNISPR